MDATIVDLRYRMKDVLRAIDRGETVNVLYRGKKKAVLTPVTDEPRLKGAKVSEQPFFGLWRDRDDMADPVVYVRELRRPRPLVADAATRRRKPGRSRQ
jgi:antitoxin (DNA-binding transcriptional repressor) of toxin-antitoxin stability system